MNFYSDESTFEEHLDRRQKYIRTMFTEEQLVCSEFWTRNSLVLPKDHEITIRTNWNWGQLYKVNKAKGLLK